MSSSLPSEIKRLKESKFCNSRNKELVGKFIDYMHTTDNSEKYKRNNLMTVRLYAEYLGEKQPTLALDSISSKEEIISFLDTRIKDEKIDPDKRWIRTWNDYLNRIKHFMRWLHNDSSIASSDWQTPSFVQIKKKKSKRISPYIESQLWEIEDLKLIIKYEPSKRNKAALALLWDFNARPHEVTLLRIGHIRLRKDYGEAEIPHDSKTGSGPAMLTLSLTYVRD
jgi:integrase/recombinase XerD